MIRKFIAGYIWRRKRGCEVRKVVNTKLCMKYFSWNADMSLVVLFTTFLIVWLRQFWNDVRSMGIQCVPFKIKKPVYLRYLRDDVVEPFYIFFRISSTEIWILNPAYYDFYSTNCCYFASECRYRKKFQEKVFQNIHKDPDNEYHEKIHIFSVFSICKKITF